MSAAAGFVVSMPAHGRSYCKSPEKLTDLIVAGGLYNKVPVIGHGDHTANGQRNELNGFFDNAEESSIVLGLLENLESCHTTVKYVKDLSSRAMSRCCLLYTSPSPRD